MAEEMFETDDVVAAEDSELDNNLVKENTQEECRYSFVKETTYYETTRSGRL